VNKFRSESKTSWGEVVYMQHVSRQKMLFCISCSSFCSPWATNEN